MQTTRIKIGGVALNQTPLDWRGNQTRIIQAVTQAKHDNIAIL